MCCTVKAFYCLSVAGLIGTSNHVVAMFFRIEHAVIFNFTTPTSTSKLCTWNVPSGSKVDVAPKRIKDICFGKAQYMKKQNSKNKTTASKRKFLAFSPNWSETANKLQKTANTHHKFYNVTKGALSGLKQSLATENPKQIMKRAFHFTLNALFLLNIFKFLS